MRRCAISLTFRILMLGGRSMRVISDRLTAALLVFANARVGKFHVFRHVSAGQDNHGVGFDLDAQDVAIPALEEPGQCLFSGRRRVPVVQLVLQILELLRASIFVLALTVLRTGFPVAS
jgi:hypothetical protein